MRLAEMHLNVTAAPPASGGATSSIPKTPEILNSIISLASCPSYSHYESQGSSSEMSPSSSITSPTEEYTLFGTNHCASSASSAYGCIGTPSPPVPDLPSPIKPLEVTKSALIKEGLKHQIKSKLKAAGISSHELLTEAKSVKEELTTEDEERRRRRRERNKIAATKCRNKKKERTCILVSESEEVEEENIKLKNEIERLKLEKMKLEKLLKDPAHIASCLHTCKSVSTDTDNTINLEAKSTDDYSCTNTICTSHSSIPYPTVSYSSSNKPVPNPTFSYDYNIPQDCENFLSSIDTGGLCNSIVDNQLKNSSPTDTYNCLHPNRFSELDDKSTETYQRLNQFQNPEEYVFPSFNNIYNLPFTETERHQETMPVRSKVIKSTRQTYRYSPYEKHIKYSLDVGDEKNLKISEDLSGTNVMCRQSLHCFDDLSGHAYPPCTYENT